MVPSSNPKCLIFDLESLPSEPGRALLITKVGALRPDTGETLELGAGKQLSHALAELDRLAEGASFVLGHNILGHDLPLLRQLEPRLRLLELPAVDTLRLSPLAFPQNPYHRLIKDYKLIRASLNSPLEDCHSTLTLLRDQQAAFSQLKSSHPQELRAHHGLLAPEPGAGLGNLFLALTGEPAPRRAALATVLPALLAETDSTQQRDLKVCRTRLARLVEQDLDAPEMAWPIAYALAWLRVSGGNSVLAPWVWHQFPAVSRLLAELRDTPCSDVGCQYCRTTHDPRRQLQRYFGFDDFRRDEKGRDEQGNSLQQDIVQAGMRGQSVLAVMATGGGKSLCYQLPALNRYHRNGSLTVIISPLQSLMKDQVDGLLARNVQCAAALNGLLNLPERVDVLERLQLGDIGILLVSPEQFRNGGFCQALRQRQVGAWIFDEAHCLSKWGSDFRPDYLYAARFIRQFTGNGPLAPIGCFTATAKQDVIDDIRQHFREELGVEFELFLGSHERSNLSFEVFPVDTGEKRARVQQILRDELHERDGGAVVFVSSRAKAETMAQFLSEREWACRHFHAGLAPGEKKEIQDDFLGGTLRVIVATNAFGMGVDKADVRLVIHADIPGSLENYLQEAGRAGRDQAAARCVLLYDPQDVEMQFGLNERARLSQRDIQQILTKLRGENAKRKGAQLVITAGEILLDDSVETSFDADDRDAETKVVTAVAWLERGEYLKREQNSTKVFPARLALSAEQALARLDQANLSARRLAQFKAILTYLYGTKADERVSTDQLLALTGQTQEELGRALLHMEELGLLTNDRQLTVYLRHKIESSSSDRLEKTLDLEKTLLAELREQAPDADQGDWLDVNLVPLTNRLQQLSGRDDLLPFHILRLLKALAQDRDGENQQRASLELRPISREYLRLRIRGGFTWEQIQALAERRRAIAAVLLRFLRGKIPEHVRGKDILVQTTFGELLREMELDWTLNPLLKPEQRPKALNHVLLYLHQQEVLILNHGMTVMRRAMTIEINTDKPGRYLKEDYQKLDQHYREKRIQVHVMREYAEVALREMAAALRLVADYFAESRQNFQRRYFAGRDAILKLATSEASWKAIVEPLNATQKLLVTADDERNRLVLAGPGSGKTRVIVHRIAWLLRVNRVPAAGIIALTFNRHAANEVRQRLLTLVGNDAFGLTVLTYHAMAMRLTGTSFAGREAPSTEQLDQVLDRAAALLEGEVLAEGEDDLRERLLRGYRYILVDEYQDIDQRQYRLVSALSKRKSDDDAELHIFAVGDDDQNIYQWRGGNNAYIEQFREEYQAELDFLVENYRSSGAIIDAANQLIQQNEKRLKADHPITINSERQAEPATGPWQTLDPQRQGKVLVLRVPGSDHPHGRQQAQLALAELQRLLRLESAETPAWHGCAVLARSHQYLWPVQAWCELHDVPYFLAADKDNRLPFHRQREFMAVIDHLRQRGERHDVNALRGQILELPLGTDWRDYFATALVQFQGEYGDGPLTTATIIDWLYDYARELRQQVNEGLYLGTVHSAKGLEFRHVVVLDGNWTHDPAHIEEERRLYYVAMTRAQQTLTLCSFGVDNLFCNALGDSAIYVEQACPVDAEMSRRYQTLSLRDLYLDFPGRQPNAAPMHAVISNLRIGDRLQLIPDGNTYAIQTLDGHVVGRTAKAFRPSFAIEGCEVAALITRFADDCDEGFRRGLRCQRWEVVVPRVWG